MQYSRWKKEGLLLVPCRVVGLALEVLCKSEVETGIVDPAACASVDFWKTQVLGDDGVWSAAQTQRVPVHPCHRELTKYMQMRMYRWLAGLNLSVVDAVVPKLQEEGSGHHDLKLKHLVPHSPFYCRGFLSVELKVTQAGPNGRGFAMAWDEWKKSCMQPMSQVLQVPNTIYGGALLLVVGICDAEDLLLEEPPLLVRAQLLVIGSNGLGYLCIPFFKSNVWIF